MQTRTPVNPDNLDDFSPVEQTATEWFFMRDRGLSPQELIRFERWLQADQAHARVFAEIEDAWGKLSHATPPAQILTAPPPAGSPRRAFIRQAAAVLAAAACLAFAYLGWWRPAHYQATLSTEVGGLHEMALPDGSQIKLNTNSAVTVSFSFKARSIRLERGEAFFTVAKDPDRPFLVDANAITVRAVGTAFNVRVHSAAVEVLVTEGRVRLHADSAREAGPGTLPPAEPSRNVPVATAAWELGPGQKILIPLDGPISGIPEPGLTPISVSRTEAEQMLAWQHRRLVYANASLAEIVSDLNRYNQHKIVIDPVSAQLGEERFGGSLPAHDHNAFVEVLEKNFPIVVERRAGETLLRAK